MAYAAPYLYLTWGGRIGSAGSGVDVWQTGLKIGFASGATVPTQPGPSILQDLYDDTIVGFHGDAAMGISQGAVLMWAKAVLVDTAGHYLTEATNYDGTGTPGGVTTDRGGPQDSLAVSLWSGGTLGHANYGRMYLPWNGFAIQSGDGRITNTQATNASIRAGDFVDDVNVWADGLATGMEVLILSKLGAGARKAPTFVRVGNVIDTQRRRRNRIKETYFATPVA